MAMNLNEETKTVNMKTYDRCCKIEINSVLKDDKSIVETVTMHYETVVEIDGVVVKKTHNKVYEYLASSLLNIKWVAPWGKEITGLDTMAFIKKFNDNFEVALSTNLMPNG